MTDTPTKEEGVTQYSELSEFVPPSEHPDMVQIKDKLGALQKLMFSKQDEEELKKAREKAVKYPCVCEDCNKTIVNGDLGGTCSEHHTHEVLNNNGGFLCKAHYERAQKYGGKCDQCCWWEVT